MSQSSSVKTWFKSGNPWVWLNAGAVSISLVMVIGLLLLIAIRGLGHFWPADIMALTYQEPGQEAETLIGERVDHESVPAARMKMTGVELPEGELVCPAYADQNG